MALLALYQLGHASQRFWDVFFPSSSKSVFVLHLRLFAPASGGAQKHGHLDT